MAGLQLSALSKRYGDLAVVEDLTLDVENGEFVVFLGPSGCGKTTTLRMIAGFVQANSGTIRIGGQDVTSMPPHKRNLGVVFQNYALFPHLTVFENVAFGLRRRGQTSTALTAKTRWALALVQLEELADRLPKQLSGGQQQRVAIARALAIEPNVLLLDEPLSNLDAKLRDEVRREIYALQRKLGMTTILVTHDQEEALSLGDRLVVMEKGRVQHIGPPQDVYRNPANLFVARFIGRATVLHGQAATNGGSHMLFTAKSGLQLLCRSATGDADTLIIRPESVRLHVTDPLDGSSALPAEVEEVDYLGSACEVVLKLPTGDRLTARVDADAAFDLGITPRRRVFAEIPPDAAYAILG